MLSVSDDGLDPQWRWSDGRANSRVKYLMNDYIARDDNDALVGSGAAALAGLITDAVTFPIVQVAAIVAAVVIVAIIAFAWVRKSSKPSEGGVPVEAFGHVVEEQARQTEALRSAVEGLAEIVHEMRKLLEARTFCPFPSPTCAGQGKGSDA